ncbi:hypothetical protein C4585_02550 [Candidatus Parcubacteria bacterium]|nr:MAG: hypothetical protein C4585_02550 [Candidatus Parcubacteria bacterium]
MHALKRLALAAAEELDAGKIGEGMRKFADYLNHDHISRGAERIDIKVWWKISEILGEKLTNDVSLRRWIFGFGGQASLLTVPGQRQIERAKLEQNIASLCDAIKKVRVR